MIKFDELERMFSIKPMQLKLTPTPHELKTFFDERRIHYAKIAKALDIPQKVYISYWLAGSRPIPKDKEEDLYILKQMFDKWEKIHGGIFNSGNVTITNKCPYDNGKIDIKFGLYFSLYFECDTCKLSKECETWSEDHIKEYSQFVKEWEKKNTPA
jgi:hypothetical protein